MIGVIINGAPMFECLVGLLLEVERPLFVLFASVSC